VGRSCTISVAPRSTAGNRKGTRVRRRAGERRHGGDGEDLGEERRTDVALHRIAGRRRPNEPPRAQTKLEWVAIDHHNTDEAHVHLLVRGVRDKGKILEINREYVRSGIRARSQEIATRELGPRLEPEILRARERAIRRERWTEIDRALERKADANRIVGYERFMPRTEGGRVRAQQEIDRLSYLERLGLSRRVSELSWELSRDHEAELRRRQRSKDVIKSRAYERQREKGVEVER